MSLINEVDYTGKVNTVIKINITLFLPVGSNFYLELILLLFNKEYAKENEIIIRLQFLIKRAL